eukprot:Blabericola_migrator_1__6792@NODE_3438_length_1777_cov_53_166082_g2138_i0_p1_GENE_NODE_3438_length_1777_cov_53_166082_g2138_i0NODE_3438_length_1777_cov_53_166082_g2138_i0_p1_ORF_typecomplete_len262_score27_04Glyco_transf_64/PF09258_10/0_29_NODE_3438_length_1777_cov_53_166082_g2138_i02771062
MWVWRWCLSLILLTEIYVSAVDEYFELIVTPEELIPNTPVVFQVVSRLNRYEVLDSIKVYWAIPDSAKARLYNGTVLVVQTGGSSGGNVMLLGPGVNLTRKAEATETSDTLSVTALVIVMPNASTTSPKGIISTALHVDIPRSRTRCIQSVPEWCMDWHLDSKKRLWNNIKLTFNSSQLTLKHYRYYPPGYTDLVCTEVRSFVQVQQNCTTLHGEFLMPRMHGCDPLYWGMWDGVELQGQGDVLVWRETLLQETLEFKPCP